MSIRPQPTPDARLPARSLAAAAGVVAAGVALGAGELVAGLLPGAPSPLAAVGSALIDLAPAGSKEVVVGLFGTNDKLALTLLVAVAVLALGAGVGLLARRSPVTAGGGIVAAMLVGVIAALRVPDSRVVPVLLLAILQAAAAIRALAILLAAAGARQGAARDLADDPARDSATSDATDATRRGFLLRAGVLGAFAIIGGGFGRTLLDRRAGAAASAATAVAAIPSPVQPAPTPPPDASFAIDGITPLVVPNGDFYRIDTALITPAVDIATWQLRVHGMVQKEVMLTFAQLVELPLVEQYVTIACVSNEVGGELVGNAKWTGVRLMDVLDMAGIQPGATQIVPRSVDGWAAGFPTSWVTEPARPREALIAVKMNDVPLPAEHGFPARLIVPGLYGYVSATKWLSELELTTLEAFDAYWVPRGWAKEAPILTMSRIDVPRDQAAVAAGPVAVAGVAWAPDRGISKVEVSVDGAAWQPAALAIAIGPQAWVQWKWAWQATAGHHVLEVRATDGTGEVQTDQHTPPAPDGARGHHQIAVNVG